MPIQKIKSGRIITVKATEYVGDKGIIFYDENTPELRLSDGATPGGILIATGGGGGSYVLPVATTSTLGGIKVGNNLTISPDGTLSAAGSLTDSFKNVKVAGQSDLVASGEDTLEIKAGVGISILTSATSSPYKSITVNSAGISVLDGGFFDTVFDGSMPTFDGGQP